VAQAMADPWYSLEAQKAEDAKVNVGQRARKQLGRAFCSTGQHKSRKGAAPPRRN